MMYKMDKIVTNMRRTKNDIVYTPKPIALKLIEMCDITPDMKVLDCCKGGGVFYDNLPECNKKYCEIEEGIDFFNETERYDLIIGNPPYSLWNKWIDQTIKLTDKFCYIFGFLNLTDDRIKRLYSNGYGITKLHLFRVNWWFGHHYIVLFEKNKPSIMTVHPNRVYCDICNDKKCKRGMKGYSPNICYTITN